MVTSIDIEIARQTALVESLNSRINSITAQGAITGRISGALINPLVDDLNRESRFLEILKDTLIKLPTIPEIISTPITEQTPTTITSLVNEQIPTTGSSLFTEQTPTTSQTQDNTLRNALLIGGAILLLV